MRKDPDLRIRRLMMATLFGVWIPASFAQTGQEAFIREYRIGPKDLLEIKVVELPELNLAVRVSEDGSITLPLIGRVELGGMTKDAAERKIAALLAEKYVNNPQVSVFIKEYQSNRVALIGAVKTPGMYEMIGSMNLLELISKAGGFADNPGNDLYVAREGKDGIQVKLTINLDDLIINGNQSLNIPLQPRDIVTVPVDKIIQVYVWGEVKNPGALSVKLSKKITLMQAIAQAGGTTATAKKSAVVIKRKDEKTGKDIQIKVNLNDIIKGKAPDPPLKEGDVVYVPESFW
jgi:polysaccharide export outer membrane protein